MIQPSLRHRPCRQCPRRLFAAFGFVVLLAAPASAALIRVDYTYDTQDFFNTQQRRDAIQAAADRFSEVITSSLAEVSPSGTGSGTSAGWRIGFTHPGTGASWQVSTAADFDSDPLIPAGADAANAYGFGGLAADEWILYAGGRSGLGSAGVGGTGTGTNFTSTLNDINGPMHRGVISNTPGNTVNDLPVWGGSIAFNSDENWHFDLSSAATGTDVDFYSIALHEIGHALGLNTGWNQWIDDVTGSLFNGSNAVAAYNADNDLDVTSLSLVSSTNRHWQDNTYDSRIFEPGNPNYVGTVGQGNLQDLLMEPVADFMDPTVRRFELTNVDVAALRDLGWQTQSQAVPEPSTIALSGVALFGFVGYQYLRRRRIANGGRRA